ncbi:MAG TPA: EAL domain-containing protein [Sphingomicrobium sp.]|nr:EAL domain-containing protein [Sphingomicrobium sp.]
MDESVNRSKSKAVRIASSHVITSCATIAAILLFVALGSKIVPAAIAGVELDSSRTLQVAFLLNIAIILFGWRRSKDLKDALDAYEAAERLAARNANTDPGTGLANRRELMRSLSEMLDSKTPGVLLFLDLDHFKRINDLHGHAAGDRVLLAVAEALKDSAPAAACCARTGGDEFAMLFPAIHDADAEKVAKDIQQRLSAPVFVEGAQVQASASIGLARLEPRDNEEGALRRSDVALYAAKRGGRNSFAWFDEELELELSDRLKLEENIRLGIRKGDFVPFFQPLIDLGTQEIVGFEALARWRSADGSMLDAENFIEAAERTGLVGPLTLSVMDQAMREARDWPANLKLAVNVSPIQFRDPTLAEQILKLLSSTGFPANRLEIEITEGSLLEDREQVLTIIESLKNVGVRISLDDFGTGYASLAQVNRLPLDRIKIDKSFITTIVKSQRTAEIVNTIAGLGHTLDVPISAEGVESEQIRVALERFGCTEAQGWLFGRAVSGDAVRSFLRMSEAGVGPEEGQAGAIPSRARRAN